MDEGEAGAGEEKQQKKVKTAEENLAEGKGVLVAMFYLLFV